MVSTEHAKNNKDSAQRAIYHSMIASALVSSLISISLLFKLKLVLRTVLSKDVSVVKYVKPYLVMRSSSIMLSIINSMSYCILAS